MRSLWLASAATIFIVGAACAQTSTSGPAPTGAPNAATMTNPGQSPGNTAPSTTGSTMSAPPDAMSTNDGPAKNASGAASGPTVTTPGISPGKTEMSTTGTTASNGMAPPMHHHHYMGMGSMAMPADASAGKYLHIAKGALKHHNPALADDALSHAETRMLDRSVPQGMIAADSDPGVSAIESARKAVKAGDMKTANMDIDMAMQQSGGMSSDMGGGAMGMSSGAMAPAPASTMAPPSLAHGNVTSSDAGGVPSVGSTSDSAAVGGNANVTRTPDKPASSP